MLTAVTAIPPSMIAIDVWLLGSFDLSLVIGAGCSCCNGGLAGGPQCIPPAAPVGGSASCLQSGIHRLQHSRALHRVMGELAVRSQWHARLMLAFGSVAAWQLALHLVLL